MVRESNESVKPSAWRARIWQSGWLDQTPQQIEWLSDNGSGYIAAKTREFARRIGLKPLTTPVRSPQSNGMAESFVKTIKRDYILCDCFNHVNIT